jgi:hypothetical protein
LEAWVWGKLDLDLVDLESGFFEADWKTVARVPLAVSHSQPYLNRVAMNCPAMSFKELDEEDM